MGRVGILTSIERTAYPRFKRLITAHELHLFFSPTREEAAWAAERMDADGHQLALLLALKSYQRMGRFPKPDEYPEMVVDFVRRAVELPEGTTALWTTHPMRRSGHLFAHTLHNDDELVASRSWRPITKDRG